VKQAPIPGGYILLARKTIKSVIMEKPPLYIKLWAWVLLQASFKDHGNLKRGQFFTSLGKMRKAMAHRVGYRVVKPTIKEIRTATKFLTKADMIGTTKVTHGLIITILNYEYYQDVKNYEGHDERHPKGHTEGTILRKKGIKKENTSPDYSEKIISLRDRYPDQSLIDSGIQAIASTRKSGKVADSVICRLLESWEKYPATQVDAGIQIFLDKDCAAQGKDEKYLTGIIRRQSDRGHRLQPAIESTGSALLDAYHANAS
jgi:hypothetical protein